MKPVNKFTGDFAFLSNFHPSPFVLHGQEWPTVEHAYQAAKTTDLRTREAIRKAPTPGVAKSIGQAVRLVRDWEQVKESHMKTALAMKFGQNDDLMLSLLATGDAILTEGNHWGDTYWGVCNGIGKNRLGVLLMELRESFNKALAKGGDEL